MAFFFHFLNSEFMFSIFSHKFYCLQDKIPDHFLLQATAVSNFKHCLRVPHLYPLHSPTPGFSAPTRLCHPCYWSYPSFLTELYLHPHLRHHCLMSDPACPQFLDGKRRLGICPLKGTGGFLLMHSSVFASTCM